MKIFNRVSNWIAGMAMFLALGQATGFAQMPFIGSITADQAAAPGSTVYLTVGAGGQEPLGYQWFRGVQPIAGATSYNLILTNISAAQAGIYSVVVSNASGSVTSAPVTVLVLPLLPGMQDPAFDTGTGFNDVVRSIATDLTGRIYVGGQFTTVNGVSRQMVARLQANGNLDLSFNATVTTGYGVFAVAVQTNQQVLIGGDFAAVNSFPRSRLVRLNSDGTLDTSFDAGLTAVGSVWAIAIQNDGKILIGGDFTTVAAVQRNRIARLNSNGTLDTSFTGDGFNNSVRAIALQPDGKIVVVGAFTAAGVTPRYRVARLTSMGDLDLTFDPGAGSDTWVNALALQPDGKIIVGGDFTYFAGVPRVRLARLHTNGVLDLSFNQATGPNANVTSMALQPDGKLFVGGGFFTVNNDSHPSFVRLTSNGANDAAFYPYAQANSWVESAFLQSDGKILIGGVFSYIFPTVNDQPRPGLARLIGGDPAPFLPIFVSQPAAQETVHEGANVQLLPDVLAFPSPSFQWRFNGTNLPGANARLLQLNNVRLANAGTYQLVASNSSGAVTSRLSVLNIIPARTNPGAVDVNFYTGDGPDNLVTSISTQSDGRALIAGYFTMVAGVSRTNVARLNPDGSLDTSFQPVVGSAAKRIAALPSGDVVIGGYFSEVNGMPQTALARLNTNGLLDASFHPQFQMYSSVEAFLVQTNGQLIVAGQFVVTNFNGLARTNLARLNNDGTVDATFNVGLGADDIVNSLAAHTGGRILVGGSFGYFNGVPHNGLVRLNSDGSVDGTFNPGSAANPGGQVRSIAVASNGKILVAGTFRFFNGQPRHQITRLNTDGSLDVSFDPGFGPDTEVSTVILLSDGKIMIGGGFRYVDGKFRFGVARLNSDGALDLTFDPGSGANDFVLAIAELPNGDLMLGGSFTLFDGLPRPYIARLHGGYPPAFLPIIADQPETQIVQAGDDVTFAVFASGIPEPRYQWQFNGADIPGATLWTLTLHNVRSTNAGNYSVIVSNSLGRVSSSPAALFVDAPSRHGGAPDISFYTGLGPNDRVHAIAVQSDQKILIGGAFTQVDGVSHNRLARLTKTGSVDAAFDVGTGANERVFALSVQADGKVFAAGSFTTINNINRTRVARLQTNGVVDPAFNPGPGANAEVYAIAVQTNGGVLIGGRFSSSGGFARNGLARLLPNGTTDPSFAPALNVSATVFTLAVQPDGKILAGGFFYNVGDSNRGRLARFNADGTLDPTFNLEGYNGFVSSVQLQDNGKIIVGGEFYSAVFQNYHVARLEPNGALDLTFTNNLFNNTVNAVQLQPDGHVIAGGLFTTVGYAPLRRLVRLDDTGFIDPFFNDGPGVQGGSTSVDEYGQFFELTTVLALAREADGKILVGGDFTRINGITRPYIARVFGREASDAVAVLKGQGVAQLIWDTGILQAADQITGPWFDVPNAESPMLYQVGGTQKFFRLKFN